MASFTRNASHHTEYLESISQGSKLYVLLYVTDPDHHITNMLKSPQSINIEAVLSVLNFSGFCLGSHCCLVRQCIFSVLCYIWLPSLGFLPTLAKLKWDDLFSHSWFDLFPPPPAPPPNFYHLITSIESCCNRLPTWKKQKSGKVWFTLEREWLCQNAAVG